MQSLLTLAVWAGACGVVNAAELESAWSQAEVRDGSLQVFQPAIDGARLRLDLELGAGRETVVLEPHSLRAPDYRLWIDAGDGRLVPGPVTQPSTYRGHVVGFAESRVTASWRDGRLSAFIDLGPELEAYGVQPVTEGDGSFRGQHLVFDERDRLPQDTTCGVTAFESGGEEGSPPDGGGGFKVCEIACDADFEFYQWNSSSVAETEGDIEFILSGVETIYAAEVEILYEITAIIVRTAEPDPYSTSGPSALLNQFGNEWSQNQNGIHRDVAHLFTGKNLTGTTIGIASLGSMCAPGGTYGLSQSNYSGNVVNRRALTAHELGHNWNAPHCDGQSDCAIMCSGLGGCTGEKQEFGTKATNKITNKKVVVANCLSDPGPLGPPALISVAPFSVDAFEGGEIVVTGTNLSNPQEVRIGEVVLAESSYSVISNSSLQITNPLILDVGLVPLTVTTLSGESNQVFLNVAAATGVSLIGPFLAFPGVSYAYKWTAAPSEPYLLLYSVGGGTTVPLGGLDVLAPSKIAQFGTISPAGTGVLTFTQSLGVFATIAFQVLTFDGETLLPSAVTNQLSTVFL